MQTLGQLIAQARKKHRISQKELASRIAREDGTAISPQYLNDIERDRRTPGDHVLQQLAQALGLESSLEYMYYLIGKWPASLRELPMDAAAFGEAVRAFRRGSESRRQNDMGN